MASIGDNLFTISGSTRTIELVSVLHKQCECVQLMFKKHRLSLLQLFHLYHIVAPNA